MYAISSFNDFDKMYTFCIVDDIEIEPEYDNVIQITYSLKNHKVILKAQLSFFDKFKSMGFKDEMDNVEFQATLEKSFVVCE